MGDLTNILRKLILRKVLLISIVGVVLSLGLYFGTLTVPTGQQSLSFASVQKLLNILAVGLLPVFLLGLFWEFLIKAEFFSYIQSEFSTSMISGRYGLRAVFENRKQAELERAFEAARERIWIQVTSFSYLTETSEVLDILGRCANRGLDIRILGLAPGTPSAELRSAFSQTYKNLAQEIPLFIDRIKDELADITSRPESIDIRLYDKIPTVACFFVDSQVYMNPLLCNKRGRASSHYLILEKNANGDKSHIFEHYEGHFERLFEESKENRIFVSGNASQITANDSD